MRERKLQRWEPSAEPDVNLSLGDTGGTWDQFQANEQLFGVKSDYDENMYTTTIDRSHPLYAQREASALRTAREIEGQDVDNVHVREERGYSHGDDLDEEEKYAFISSIHDHALANRFSDTAVSVGRE